MIDSGFYFYIIIIEKVTLIFILSNFTLAN
jgi:hypothetical protein